MYNNKGYRSELESERLSHVKEGTKGGGVLGGRGDHGELS